MPQAARILTTAPDPHIRVMVVDDAVVFRGLVTRWLGEEPGTASEHDREVKDTCTRANPN